VKTLEGGGSFFCFSWEGVWSYGWWGGVSSFLLLSCLRVGFSCWFRWGFPFRGLFRHGPGRSMIVCSSKPRAELREWSWPLEHGTMNERAFCCFRADRRRRCGEHRWSPRGGRPCRTRNAPTSLL